MRTRLIGLLFVVASLNAHAVKEDWYWGFALGPTLGSFSNVGTTGNSSSDRVGMISDIFFSFPIQGGNTTIGPSLTGFSQTYEAPRGSAGMLAFTIAHSFGPQPGEGFYIRGDVGMGRIDFNWTETELGFGFLAAFGYGFAISDQTRFLVSAGLHGVFATGHAISGGIFFGPMF